MPTRYLILRSNVDVDENIDLSRPSAWRKRTGGLSELTIQINDGHEKDADDLRADLKNLAVMDANTKLSLIMPKARDVCDVSDTTALKIAGALRMPEGLLAVKPTLARLPDRV
jgi:hypothetical protein